MGNENDEPTKSLVVLEMEQKSKSMALEARSNFGGGTVPQPLVPQNFDQFWLLASTMSKTEMVPQIYQGKPDACFVAMQMGAEVGLSPMSSLQNIAVINGLPSVWGDAQLAIVKNSKQLKDIEETIEGSGNNLKATCMVLREEEVRPVTREFTFEDAKVAGLTNKDNWKKYPKRMLQMRARAWALRDAFPDILKGLGLCREEVVDLEPGKDGIYQLEAVRESIKEAVITASPAEPAAPAKEKFEETEVVDTESGELDLSVWEDKDNWFKKRGGDGKTTGFGKFVRDNLDAFGFLSEELQEEILAKWKRTYPETDFPAIPAPKISSEKKTEEPAPQTTLDVLKSEILTDDEKFDHCADEIRNRESLTQLSSWAEVNSDKAGSVLPEAMFNDLCKIFKEREELLVGPENEDEEPAEKEQEVECPNDNSMVLLSKCDVEGVCNMRKGCPAHY